MGGVEGWVGYYSGEQYLQDIQEVGGVDGVGGVGQLGNTTIDLAQEGLGYGPRGEEGVEEV